MTKSKSTKRALTMSVISLLICFTMLLGTTYAWFTDSVVSGNNKIIAGNLDVELEYSNAPDGTYSTVEGVGDIFVAPSGATKGLWEPGHTEVAYLKVTNKGTLALQYNLGVSSFKETVGKNADGGDIRLSEVLKFASTFPSETALAAFTRESAQQATEGPDVATLGAYSEKNVSLAPGKSHYVALVVYMPETVGNGANYRGDVIPYIEFAVSLLATQEEAESDSFGTDYDAQATYSNQLHYVDPVNATVNTTGTSFTYENEDKTLILSGEKAETAEVKVTATAIDADPAVDALYPSNAKIITYDIKVEGHTDNSDVTVKIFVGKNITDDLYVYHKDVLIADKTNYDADSGYVTFVTDSFSNYTVVALPSWDGSADTSWYNENDIVFALDTPAEIAGLAVLVDGGETFEGKVIQLVGNVDLENVLFNPIGSYRKDLAFKGTFDGNGYTISNLSQNTWELDNGYYYGDLGLGLFGKVRNATIKNLTIDGASISGESAICGTVAATAYGDCVFENITVKNSKVNDYQYYAGGIVGWASGDHTYTNINVDESTIIGSQWGDFGNASGGIIGGAGSSGTYTIKDSTVACRIDATNDVVSAYQWYNYRNSGMIVGTTGRTATNDAVTDADASNFTCENVTVIYGEWANYHYCEFAGTGYPYVRVEAGVSVDAYSNVRYGHPTDANGNVVVDDNHVHNEGEDHLLLIAFDNLFGGDANARYCYYGIATHPGVNVVYNNK